MDTQINKYQQRLFNKLFSYLPGVRNVKGFNDKLNLDVQIKSFYFYRNKDFWFTRGEKEDKYLYLFGIKNKPIKDISGDDVCLIIDFDKNVQFNDNCLGLFSIKNSEINILINYTILKGKYPYINDSDFKITTFKSIDNSINLEVIDLGILNDNFIENIEKLVKEAYKIKSKEGSLQNTKTDYNSCKICSINKNNFKIDSNLNSLKNLKPDLCGKCIEKIVVSEFYTKLVPLLNRNDTAELKIAKKKFKNDKLFDIGITLLEKYGIIRYIGVKKLYYSIDRDSYLVKKFLKFSDKNNLLMDNIIQTSEPKIENGKYPIPKIVKKDSFGNKNTVLQMNTILEELANGENEEEAISHAKVSQSTYKYWLNRGKQEFGEVYIQFYNYINELKSMQSIKKNNDVPKNVSVDKGIYEPILKEYETSFDSISESGIAWVKKNGIKWYYSRNINGKLIRLSAYSIPELYEKVINENLIWGICDYSKAKEFIDIPEDFEIPIMEIEEGSDKLDSGIYASLPKEYEDSFSSMNKSGIAWVNQIGKKWIYSRNINGKTIKFDDVNIYELYDKVKEANQIWGIRDYDKAKNIIDIPEDFKVPSKPQIEELVEYVDVEIDPGIYAPLPKEYEDSFSSMNKSGIAWVNQIGSKFYYTKSIGGKYIRLAGENIYKLYNNVKKSNNVWGIRDYDRAKVFIDIPDDFEIPTKQESVIVSNNESDESIYSPLSRDQLSKFNPNPNNKTGIAWVNKVGNNWIYQRQKNGKIIRIADPSIVKLHEKVINNNQVWGIIDIEKARKVIESDSIGEEKYSELPKETKPININSKVTVNYIEKPMNKFEILIKGSVKNRDLIDILIRLDLFKENIKRIITNSIGKESDIFIEIAINKYLLHAFEEKIEDLGWEIIR